jgi:hypothetical protein
MNMTRLLEETEKSERADQFQYWLSDFDRFEAEWRATLELDLTHQLDHSIGALVAFEAYILHKFQSAEEVVQDVSTHNAATTYFGETIRREIGGTWHLPLDDPDYLFFGKPELKDVRGLGRICPMSYVSTCASRRRATCARKTYSNG